MSKIAGASAALKEREEEEQKLAARSAVNWKVSMLLYLLLSHLFFEYNTCYKSYVQ